MKKSLLLAATVLLGWAGFSAHAEEAWTPLDRTGWTANGCSQQETGATFGNVIDGDNNTIWHTIWSNACGEGGNHYLYLDLGEEVSFNGFGYKPQNSAANGTLNGDYNFYVLNDVTGLNLACSDDFTGKKTINDSHASLATLVNGKTADASGSYTCNSNAEYRVKLEKTATGRYVIFQFHGKNDNGTCSEFNLYNVTDNGVTVSLNIVAPDGQTLNTGNTVVAVTNGNVTDYLSTISIPFFTITGVREENKTVTETNKTFTLDGNWSVPFQFNHVYRMAVSGNNWKYTPEKISAAPTNTDFTSECMWYAKVNGFNAEYNTLLVNIFPLVDLSKGLVVSTTANGGASLGDTASDLNLFPNNSGNGVCFRLGSNNYVNYLGSWYGNKVGTWQNAGNVCNDGGNLTSFISLTDDELSDLNLAANATPAEFKAALDSRVRLRVIGADNTEYTNDKFTVLPATLPASLPAELGTIANVDDVYTITLAEGVEPFKMASARYTSSYATTNVQGLKHNGTAGYATGEWFATVPSGDGVKLFSLTRGQFIGAVADATHSGLISEADATVYTINHTQYGPVNIGHGADKGFLNRYDTYVGGWTAGDDAGSHWFLVYDEAVYNANIAALWGSAVNANNGHFTQSDWFTAIQNLTDAITTAEATLAPEATAAEDGEETLATLLPRAKAMKDEAMNAEFGRDDLTGKISELDAMTAKLQAATTGIEEIGAGVSGERVVYDLQGRRVANPRHGLYIVNGVKTVIR